MPPVDCWKFFFSLGWTHDLAVNLLCMFDVKLCGDCGVLCYWVSPMKVTNSCNQSLFTGDPPPCFHHLFPLTLSLSLSYQNVSVMWRGPWVVLEPVNRWVFIPTSSEWYNQTMTQFGPLTCRFWSVRLSHSFVCLSRKVGSVTASPMHMDTRVTPARMGTSCCRRRTILVAKVTNPVEVNFLVYLTQ